VGIYNVLAVRGRWCQRLHRGHERRSGEPERSSQVRGFRLRSRRPKSL